MTKEEFYSHAARCSQLAFSCTDPSIAAKLQQLADEYAQLARQHLTPIDTIKTSAALDPAASRPIEAGTRT
jgi:hypothetical protein